MISMNYSELSNRLPPTSSLPVQGDIVTYLTCKNLGLPLQSTQPGKIELASPVRTLLPQPQQKCLARTLVPQVVRDLVEPEHYKYDSLSPSRTFFFSPTPFPHSYECRGAAIAGEFEMYRMSRPRVIDVPMV